LKKIAIISDEYKDSFKSIEIEKGVYLKNEDNYIIVFNNIYTIIDILENISILKMK
jgi:hypothetical protein